MAPAHVATNPGSESVAIADSKKMATSRRSMSPAGLSSELVGSKPIEGRDGGTPAKGEEGGAPAGEEGAAAAAGGGGTVGVHVMR